MTNGKLGRWLLVAFAIVGLTFAAPIVSAPGTNKTADDVPTDNATPDEWATWMEAQTTDHRGLGSAEWMASHLGVTVDELAQDMADEEYHDDHRCDEQLEMLGLETVDHHTD